MKGFFVPRTGTKPVSYNMMKCSVDKAFGLTKYSLFFNYSFITHLKLGLKNYAAIKCLTF